MLESMARRNSEQIAQINIDFLCVLVDSFMKECSKKAIEPTPYNFAVYIIDRSLVNQEIMLAVIISERMNLMCGEMQITNSDCCKIFAQNYGLHHKNVFRFRKRGQEQHKRKYRKFAKSNLFL